MQHVMLLILKKKTIRVETHRVHYIIKRDLLTAFIFNFFLINYFFFHNLLVYHIFSIYTLQTPFRTHKQYLMGDHLKLSFNVSV